MAAKTKVFISWSGEFSKLLAQEIRDWLPTTLQFVEPYFTPEDIEKGKGWTRDIVEELELSKVGIICLTKENTKEPWINFEAGALFKGIPESRVCSVLFDLKPVDVTGPLAMLQQTKFIQEDFRRLVKTINSSAGEQGLEPRDLDKVFDKWWPDLDENVQAILANPPHTPAQSDRTDRDVLEEILDRVRRNTQREMTPSSETDSIGARQCVFEMNALLASLVHKEPTRKDLWAMCHLVNKLIDSVGGSSRTEKLYGQRMKLSPANFLTPLASNALESSRSTSGLASVTSLSGHTISQSSGPIKSTSSSFGSSECDELDDN